jgi:predicted amidohydrolase
VADTLSAMRTGLCQFSASQDVAANRRAVAAVVEEAAAAGARLVVLPEASMCGFGSTGTDLTGIAEPLDGPFVTTLRRSAAHNGCTVIAGTFEPSPITGKVFNTVVVVGPDGAVDHYRKVHLYDGLGWKESDTMEPGAAGGDNVVTVEVEGFHLGVMTCFDLRFPEVARTLIDAGADLLVVPAAWVSGPGKGEQWRVMLQARAIENTAYVLGVGQPGPVYTGLSMAVDPRGHVMASLPEVGTGIIGVDLDPERIGAVRSALPLLAERRFDVRPRSR